MSFALHSSIENLGGGRRSGSVGSNSSFRLQLAGEVLDRADVGEGLGETSVEEPLERIALDRDQVGQGQNLVKICKRETLRSAGT